MLCDVDSVVDSEADVLVAPVLPGVRTVLPSVARVFRFAAVTSYETGVISDMIYIPSALPVLTEATHHVPVVRVIDPVELDLVEQRLRDR